MPKFGLVRSNWLGSFLFSMAYDMEGKIGDLIYRLALVISNL